jgi:hypothetical protein
MTRPTRRTVLTASISLPMAASAQPITAASPDADLIRFCAEHVVNMDAFNRDRSDLDAEDNPLWAAYERTRDAIHEARPQTIEGMLAKARAAKVEALMPDGRENPSNCPAETWAWDLLNDLLRLNSSLASSSQEQPHVKL